MPPSQKRRRDRWTSRAGAAAQPPLQRWSCFLCSRSVQDAGGRVHFDELRALVRAFARRVPLDEVTDSVYSYYHDHVRPELIQSLQERNEDMSYDAARGVTRWSRHHIRQHILQHPKPWEFVKEQELAALQTLIPAWRAGLFNEDHKPRPANLNAYLRMLQTMALLVPD